MIILSFLEKLLGSNPKWTGVVDKSCADLYKDKDFIEVKQMSSEAIRAEIKAGGEDPDDVLALIKGRLENKIIPVNANKNTKPNIDIASLLIEIVNKKIINDIFESKPTKINRASFFIKGGYYFLIVVSILLFAKSIFGLEGENSIVLAENKNIINHEKSEITNIYNIPMTKIEDLKPVSEDRTEPTLSTINTNDQYTTNRVLFSAEGNNNLEHLYITSINKNPYRENSNHQVMLEKTVFNNKEEDIFLSKEYNKIKITNKNIITRRIKKGDSLYAIFKEENIETKNTNDLKNLPPLISGKTIVLAMKDNYVEKITYKNGYGISHVFFLNSTKENKKIENKYQTSVVKIEIKLDSTEKNSFFTALRSNEIFVKNNLLADRATFKIESYFKDNHPSKDLSKLKKGAGFLITLELRRYKNEILDIEKITKIASL